MTYISRISLHLYSDSELHCIQTLILFLSLLWEIYIQVWWLTSSVIAFFQSGTVSGKANAIGSSSLLAVNIEKKKSVFGK